MKWKQAPERVPHRCLITRQGAEQDAPYLDMEFEYLLPVRDEQGRLKVKPQVQRLYLSSRGLRDVVNQPGSGMRAYTEDEMAELEARANAFEEEAADLAAQLEEARAEIETLRAAGPIDYDQLSTFLDARYAKKPGPKAKA